MDILSLRPFLLTLCLVASPVLITAGETAPPTAQPQRAAQPASNPAPDPVLVLPKIEVTASRIKKLDKLIVKLDKMIAREKNKVKSSELDKTLNNAALTRAATVFGGNSAAHLSAIAAYRVTLLENERAVLEAMKRPATLDELAMMEAEVEQLQLTRRNLDDAAKQR